MAKENEADIEIPDEESFEGIEDAAELKAKLEDVQKKHREAGIRNRERTKAQKDRVAELEAKIASLNVSEKPDEKLLKKMGAALLRASGYSDPEELAVFDRWAKDTGKSSDDLLDHPSLMKVIKTEIDDIRTAKANAAATDNVQGRGEGGGGSKTDPNYWINRNETPPSTPEYKKVREEMRNIMVQKESGTTL